jgi:predicted MarR family transcription regulator
MKQRFNMSQPVPDDMIYTAVHANQAVQHWQNQCSAAAVGLTVHAAQGLTYGLQHCSKAG